MKLNLLLPLTALGALMSLGAMTSGAQAGWTPYDCPTSVQSTVSFAGDSSWIATNQGSSLDRLEIQVIAGQRSIVCVYWLFGTPYWVHRPFPERSNCRPNLAERRFYCWD